MVSLQDIRHCFEGMVPSVLSTCNREGLPNISYISNVHYVDSQHVALTFQFFNKTHQNISENPHARINLIDPHTANEYSVHLLYRRTESDGPLFEEMKAKLANIAELSGMQNVFKLMGADVYQVISIVPLALHSPVPAHDSNSAMFKLKNLYAELNKVNELASLTELLLKRLHQQFGYEYSMLLLADDNQEFLYTLDSLGYPASGVGSEVPFGVGTIGICAKFQIPLRIVHTTTDYNYIKAMDKYHCQQQMTRLEQNIAFPGLPQPRSQMAIPMVFSQRLLGVLYLESECDLRFSFQDEDLLSAIAAYLGQKFVLIQALEQQKFHIGDIVQPGSDQTAGAGEVMHNSAADNEIMTIRFAPHDGSIFLDQDYLIKGVAGKILWRLLELSRQQKRHSFSNRELRLDKHLQLPEVGDNLEARLVLLKRRLLEKTEVIRILPLRRGVFELKLLTKVELEILDSQD